VRGNHHAFAHEGSFGRSSIRFLVGVELGMPMTAILKVSIHVVAYYITMIVQGIRHLSVWEKEKDVRVSVLITMQCPPQTSSICWQVPLYRCDRSEAITLAVICMLCCQPSGRAPGSNFGTLWHQQDCFLGFPLKRSATWPPCDWHFFCSLQKSGRAPLILWKSDCALFVFWGHLCLLLRTWLSFIKT
jgi:hypothetical protein